MAENKDQTKDQTKDDNISIEHLETDLNKLSISAEGKYYYL